MKKKSIAAALLMMVACGVFATPLTPQQALERLGNDAQARRAPTANASSMELVRTFDAKDGIAALYVFSNSSDGSYIVVSADDLALPLLGYADAGSFNDSPLSPAFEWWMNEYASQIEYARANNLPSSEAQEMILRRDRESRSPITPMIRTNWDQVPPFNDQCPKYGLERTYTGCVATAMAQVMKYWNYPERGQGSITYNASTLQKKLSMDFSKQPFEWDNMIDNYFSGDYTEEEASAVAYLMKAAGYAVRSDFGTDSTGALAMYIRDGLIRFFNYDGNARYDLRIMYSGAEWERKIYDNLVNVGPLLYGGGSMIGGGHSFVCDGYDKDGYFHFNWGWSGISDGYFLLNALNPGDLGSGGGNGGGYNFTQDAIFGIQPPTGEPVTPQPDQLIEIGSLVAEMENGVLLLDLDMTAGPMWVNYTPSSLKINLGVCFTPVSGNGEKQIFLADDRTFPIPPGYGIDPTIVQPKVNMAETGLPDGTYRASMVTRPEDGGEDTWVPVRNPHAYYDYVLVTVDGGKYSVKDIPAPSLDVIDGGFISDIYIGCQTKVFAKVKNNSDIELSTGLAPVLADANGAKYLGESVMVSVMPGETEYVEWTTPLYDMNPSIWGSPLEPVDYLMTFMDEESMLTYAGDLAKQVTVLPTPDTPTVSLQETPKLENASIYRPSGHNDPYNTYYMVSDPGNMIVTGSIKVTEGVFAYPVQALLCAESEYDGMVEILATGSDVLFLNAGESGDFRMTVSYPPLEPRKDYLMIVAYSGPLGVAALPGATKTVHVRLDSSGMEDYGVSCSETVSTQVLDMTGQTVMSVSGKVILSTLPSGIYVVRETLENGEVKTRKIIR